MTRKFHAFAATALAAPLMLFAATPAAAEERVCRGTIGATTVDNLRVPDYASCERRLRLHQSHKSSAHWTGQHMANNERRSVMPWQAAT